MSTNFFGNARNISIFDSNFSQYQGNQYIHNGNVYNTDSNNTTSTIIRDSFNNQSSNVHAAGDIENLVAETKRFTEEFGRSSAGHARSQESTASSFPAPPTSHTSRGASNPSSSHTQDDDLQRFANMSDNEIDEMLIHLEASHSQAGDQRVPAEEVTNTQSCPPVRFPEPQLDAQPPAMPVPSSAPAPVIGASSSSMSNIQEVATEASVPSNMTTGAPKKSKNIIKRFLGLPRKKRPDVVENIASVMLSTET